MGTTSATRKVTERWADSTACSGGSAPVKCSMYSRRIFRGIRAIFFSLLVPTHGIIILETAETQLTIRALDVEAIKKLLKGRPSLVDHIVIPNRFEPKGEDVVLTAPTLDVRKFLSDILDRPGVLGEPFSWRRQ